MNNASSPATFSHAQSTADDAEVAKFNALAASWWDHKGPMAPLHAMNPARLAYVRDALCTRFDRVPTVLNCLAGLRLLDLGCGAGLLSEPLARMGADVVAIDAAAENIEVARRHAEMTNARVDYRTTTAEALVAAGERFDGVISLEVIEHVADVPAFAQAISSLIKPGGMTVLSTLNRTPQSFLVAIVGAEYIARVLPRGTHEWRKFITPDELAVMLRGVGLTPAVPTGLIYDPIARRWRTSRRLGVNYFLSAMRD
jgi:2-polyprenyl-6-hydroxyphenyl methylase / 3-demethylubiquinone-9 3-methyltransferase